MAKEIKVKEKQGPIWKTIVGLLVSFIHVVPFYIAATIAFKPKTDLTSRWMFPKELYLDNFKLAIEKANIFMAIKNSIIITAIAVVLVMVVGAMAAYPLARYRHKFNRGVLSGIVAMMMVPPLSILVPLVTMMSRMGGISSFWGIICIVTTYQLPMSVFLYANFIVTIPDTLDEAATIDGCSKFSVFFRIILPLLKPVTATVVILTGVFIWNDYQFSLYILQDPSMKVVTLAVSTFFAQSSSNIGAAAASALIAIMPITILYLSLQKYFVNGMVDGAVKG